MIPPTYMLMRPNTPLSTPVSTDIARPQPPAELHDAAAPAGLGIDMWIALTALAGLAAYAGVIDLLR